MLIAEDKERVRKVKVSGSILAVKDNYIQYAKQLKYSGVDNLHIDIFQNGEAFTIKDLLKFDETFLPLDIHLIFKSLSEEDVEILNQVNAEYINVQYESLEDPGICHWLAKRINGKFGIAITSKTSCTIIDEYKDEISQVLFMCSEPGVSGKKFDESNYERVRNVHIKYPSLFLAIDGGINAEIGEKMGQLGASLLVSGSYLSKDISELSKNIYFLKYMNEKNICVKRKMLPIGKLPLVAEDDSFMHLIDVMNHYRLGMVFVVNGDKLQGVVSDGDIRRAFISYKENIFKLVAHDLMNVQPLTIGSNETIEDLYCKINKAHRGIDVVPVIEGDKMLGVVDLHMGI